ncbi:hypothetical protein [Ruminococcus albus]|uniref:Uncharacterized protein n=1 Tax=Ruminococcus albus TaxID=1264 RepID=A0A1I1GZB5_RUMAL|nr:hypothetical protein [Ruminococcus albus]SFC17137.1 hypothetical protein SAMN02910406_01274 [Ruminococcus albus]
MIVNYYGICGCECIWDQNGLFLAAPAGVQVQSLKQLGFYTAADGRWYKQLSPQESAYLDSMKNMAVVDLPAKGPSFGMTPNITFDAETPEDKKKANTMCIISLLLMFCVNPLIVEISRNGYENITSISGFSGLAALILMIYVRVKYPKNTFGKVLMIVYIVFFVLGLIWLTLIMAMCASCMKDCHGF